MPPTRYDRVPIAATVHVVSGSWTIAGISDDSTVNQTLPNGAAGHPVTVGTVSCDGAPRSVETGAGGRAVRRSPGRAACRMPTPAPDVLELTVEAAEDVARI